MKGTGHKHTGRGPKQGFSFPSKAGFSGSTGRTEEIRSYTRHVPKRKFADGGVVKVPDPGSSVEQRTKPVTEFDAQHGGKGPLRPGYKEGGKVGTVGAAIKMVKALMARGESAESAAKKAAARYNVPKADVAPAAVPAGGGGMPADKQMLARGGMAGALQTVIGKVGMAPRNQPIKMAPNGAKAAVMAARGRAGPIKAPVAAPVAAPRPVGVDAPTRTTGYGSFGRNPLIGR
jgi:hypothetical protein